MFLGTTLLTKVAQIFNYIWAVSKDISKCCGYFLATFGNFIFQHLLTLALLQLDIEKANKLFFGKVFLLPSACVYLPLKSWDQFIWLYICPDCSIFSFSHGPPFLFNVLSFNKCSNHWSLVKKYEELKHYN